MSVRSAALAAGVLGLATVALSPGAASAAATPQLSVLSPSACYVNSTTYSTKTGAYTEHYARIKVHGSGWTAGTRVQLNFAGSEPANDISVGSDGTFTATVKVPDPPLGLSHSVHDGSSVVTATDVGNASGSDPGGTTVSTKSKYHFTVRSVYLWDGGDYDGETSDLGAGDPVRFNAAGFPSGRTLYAHYVFTGTTGKAKPTLWRTVALGRTSGPCGVLQRHGHVAPTSPPVKLQGDYTLQFDTSRTYSARTWDQSLFHFNLS